MGKTDASTAGVGRPPTGASSVIEPVEHERAEQEAEQDHDHGHAAVHGASS